VISRLTDCQHKTTMFLFSTLTSYDFLYGNEMFSNLNSAPKPREIPTSNTFAVKLCAYENLQRKHIKQLEP